MIRYVLAAAALLLTTPLAAQNQQERLQERYDRALAAGYKALFLCSAIANAERNGATRTPESVEQWELTGIQAPLDQMVGDLPYEIERLRDRSTINHVAVSYGGSSKRYAVATPFKGCATQPIGFEPEPQRVVLTVSSTAGAHKVRPDPLAVDFGEKLIDVGRAFDGAYGEGRTTIVSVLRHGKLVGEQYAEGFFANTPQRTWSVAKSIAATLVGAAVFRGEADVNVSAGLGADETDPRRAITIDHLLRMASGRYSDTPGNQTDPLYFGGSTVEETALHWPLIEAPGTSFRYANNDTLAAIKAIEGSFEEHPPADFFAQLGMDHTVAETDWQGDYILSSQVWSTARDLAKLGQLYLNDGKLPDGTRILPEGWVEYVSSPSGPQPDGPMGYGAGFWLINKSEGVPPDTFAAIGNRGQYIVIVPSRDVVIVRRGEDPVGARFDIISFTRDVLAALEN